MRVWVLAAGTFAVGTDAFAVAGILPLIAADLRATIDAVARIVSAYAIAYAVGAPVLAAMASPLTRNSVVPGALLCFAISNLLCALAPGLAALGAARILAGASAAVFVSAAYSTAADLVPAARRGSGLAAVASGLSASAVLGVPFGVWLGHALHWRMTFAFVALLAFAVTLALGNRLANARRAVHESISLAHRLAPVKNSRILIALAPIAFCAAATSTVYTFFAEVVRQAAPRLSLAALLFVYGLGGLLGSQTGGWLSDRYGTNLPILGVVALNAIVLGTLHWTISSDLCAPIAMLAWGLGGWAIFAAQQGRLHRLEPTNSHLVLALNQSCIYLGSAGGAWLGATLLGWGVPVPGLTYFAASLFFLAFFVFAVSMGMDSRCHTPSAPARHKGPAVRW